IGAAGEGEARSPAAATVGGVHRAASATEVSGATTAAAVRAGTTGQRRSRISVERPFAAGPAGRFGAGTAAAGVADRRPVLAGVSAARAPFIACAAAAR